MTNENSYIHVIGLRISENALPNCMVNEQDRIQKLTSFCWKIDNFFFFFFQNVEINYFNLKELHEILFVHFKD